MQDSKIINPQELKTEADYLELERLSIKLGIPVPMVRIQVKAELDGKITDLYEDRSRTWNRNYWNAIYVPVCGLGFVATNFGAGYLSQKQTSGTVAALTSGNYGWNIIGPINEATYGILPGRGAGAESFEGYVLTTPITHGTGANQLGFRLQAASAQNYTAGTKLWTATLTRLFDNTSGNTITITETAIVSLAATLGTKVMMCRDLLAASIDVLNNGVLTITYTITLTFPE